MIELQNWSGNYKYEATGIHYPETIDQVQELVMRCERLKPIGTRHSFNSIADTTADLVSTERLDKLVALDRHTVTVEAGMKYGQLCKYLHSHGFALHNLASLPHISISGAVATATHGSGDKNGNLATTVSGMEIVTADGNVKTLSREQDGEEFKGAVVGLGGLGVVTKLTLDISPTFDMRQDVYENLPMMEVEEHFDAITASAYSVSLFTDWRSASFNQVWFKRQILDGCSFSPEPEFFGATLAAIQHHPLEGISAENCTEQMGIPGPWFDRLPHFRMDFTPSAGEELQSEYILPREHAVEALRAVYELRELILPLILITEVRTIAADDLWMSTCYKQASIAIHFTWKKDWFSVQKLLPEIENALAPFHARPHWGKLFTMCPSQLQSLYEKLPDFRQLLHSYDPKGKFRNAFLDTYIF